MFQNITRLQLPEIMLLGIKCRTNNDNEQSVTNSAIAPTVAQYYSEDLSNKMPNRVNPGRVFGIYTDYESDETGHYTYFIGEEVKNFDNVPDTLFMHVIPSQLYMKFTTYPGPIPYIIMEAWQEIWKMDEKALNGKRTYLSDFDIYDQRSLDQKHAVVDIYVGINI